MATVAGAVTGSGIVLSGNGGVANPALDTQRGAHRYWRLFITANNGDPSFTAVEDLFLYDIENPLVPASDPQSDPAFSTDEYLASTAANFNTLGPGNAFHLTADGSGFGSVWLTENGHSVPSWVGIKFPEPKDIVRYTVVYADGNTSNNMDRAPTAFCLQFSDDGINWFTRQCDTATWPAISPTRNTFPDYVKSFDVGDFSYTVLDIPLVEVIATGFETLPDIEYETDIELPLFEVAATGLEEAPIALDLLSGIEVVGEGLTGVVTSEFLSDVPIPLPGLEVFAVGDPGQFLDGDIELPSITSEGSGFSEADSSAIPLPFIEVEAEGTIGSSGVGYIFLPPLSTEATGLFVSDQSGTGESDAVVPFWEVDAEGYGGQIGHGDIDLPGLILAAEGYTGSVGNALINLPALCAEGEGFAEINGSISIFLPSIDVVATGTGSNISAPPVVNGNVQSRNTYAMNLSHKGLTEYKQFGFNSMATFNGVRLAANSQGIFALTGDTDNGEFIDASVRLGNLDMDSIHVKAVDYAYVGYRTDGNLELRAQTDDGQEYCYPLKPRHKGQHTSRARLSKGVQGRYWRMSVHNQCGSDFCLDTLEFMTREMKRRIW